MYLANKGNIIKYYIKLNYIILSCGYACDLAVIDLSWLSFDILISPKVPKASLPQGEGLTGILMVFGPMPLQFLPIEHKEAKQWTDY